MSKTRKAYFVLSTHWDREWRVSFQEMRYDMVHVFDHVIAGLEDGRLKGPFVTDGQAVLIEDYLEIRPERREQVARLIRTGKLMIGPWYTMPDEFLPSGEALIRNLRLGRDIARSFGGVPSSAGYICDMFGHTSQMPQIFAGFGIRGAFLFRGINNPDTRNVIWRGADGAEIFTVRFGQIGYGDYAIKVRRVTEDPDLGCDAANFPARLEKYLEDEASKTDVDAILIHDSLDHLDWDEEAYRLVRDRMSQARNGIELVHTSFEEYLDDAISQCKRVATVVEGELREPGLENPSPPAHPVEGKPAAYADTWASSDWQWLIEGIASSRVRLKQANAHCETLLCAWAEPFSAFATAALGSEYPDGFLSLAWRNLLQNQPHDSLGGCSIDQVHTDMEHRFDQARLIADRLALQATRSLAASVEGELSEKELRVVVFNPLPRDYDGVAEILLKTPGDWPTFNEFFGFEPKPSFRIFGPDGEEIPYQRLIQTRNRTGHRYLPNRLIQFVGTHDVTVALKLSIPPLGYTTLTVRPGYEGLTTRYGINDGLATGEAAMQNEYLAVRIESNGAITLTDLATGASYSRLLTYEESADIGDGWHHGWAANDQVFASTACAADIALIHNGPLSATFCISTIMRIPEEFDFSAFVRVDRRVEMNVKTYVTLRAGSRQLEVRTTVDNNARDHRLRVLLPSGAQTQTYLAESAFDVVERPIALRADNDRYREIEIETRPQQNWTAVFDEIRGLAVMSAGLRETAIRDQPERPIALTLFRGTRRTATTSGEPNGQELGKLTFDFLVQPLAGAPDRTQLSQRAQFLASGLRTAQLRLVDQKLNRTGVTLPPTDSLLRLTGPAVLTSARQVAGALEVRVFNPLTEPCRCEITLNRLPRVGGADSLTAELVNFDSEPVEPLALDGRTAVVSLRPKQIVTVRFATR